MENNGVFVPMYSLSPTRLTLYENFEGYKSDLGNKQKGFDNLKNNENLFGELSSNARRRLNKATDYLLYLTKKETKSGKGPAKRNALQYKVTFVTLTLPSIQIHSDKVLKEKLLNQFLIELKKNHGVEKYIWKAEKQKNGNLHFHILVDKFIHWRVVRDMWNRICNKLGYVDAYTSKMKKIFANGFRPMPIEEGKPRVSLKVQKRRYNRGQATGWTDPNSTDIHALYRVENVMSYISKYMSKADDDRRGNMKFLMEKIEEKQKELEVLALMPGDNSEQMLYTENALMLLEDQLNDLKKLGVEGRIWGCSQLISKIRNFSNCEAAYNIPDIELVEKIAKKKFVNKITDSICTVTYIFDVFQTPNLKRLLDEHIEREKELYSEKVKAQEMEMLNTGLIEPEPEPLPIEEAKPVFHYYQAQFEFQRV